MRIFFPMRFFFAYTFFIRFSTKLYVFMRFFYAFFLSSAPNYTFFSILKTGHHELVNIYWLVVTPLDGYIEHCIL